MPQSNPFRYICDSKTVFMIMINCRISAHQRTLVIKDNSNFFINIVNRGIDIGFTSFELCYVDGIGVLCAGSQVSNLSRNCIRNYFSCFFIFFFGPTYGNGGVSRYPSSIVFVRLSMGLAFCIITGFSGFGRGNGFRAEGYTTIDSSVCVIADHDGIFDIFGMILDWNLFSYSIFKRTIRMFIRHSPCGFRLLRNLFLCIIHRAEDNVMFPVF